MSRQLVTKRNAPCCTKANSLEGFSVGGVDPVKILHGQVQRPMPTVPIVIPFLEHVVLDQCGVSNRRDDNLTHENHNCENHKCEKHKCENRQCDQTKSEIRKSKNHTNSTEKNGNAKNLMHDYLNLHCCEILWVIAFFVEQDCTF